MRSGAFNLFLMCSLLFLYSMHCDNKSTKLCLDVTGALTGGQMGPGELLQQRLRCGQVREALGVLEAMDWSITGDECYRGLSSVTDHLLRLELNAEREGGSNI